MKCPPYIGVDLASGRDESAYLVIYDETAPFTEEDYERVKAILKERECSLGSKEIHLCRTPW